MTYKEAKTIATEKNWIVRIDRNGQAFCVSPEADKLVRNSNGELSYSDIDSRHIITKI